MIEHGIINYIFSFVLTLHSISYCDTLRVPYTERFKMENVIDAGLKLIANSSCNHLKPHLIFCMGWDSFQAWETICDWMGNDLWNIILNIMKKYDIKSSLLTVFKMERLYLITKGLVEPKKSPGISRH